MKNLKFMKRNTNIDYYEDEEVEPHDEVVQGALELSDIIEEKLSVRPKKGTASFRLWKNEVNKLITSYNEKFGKVYTHVK